MKIEPVLKRITIYPMKSLDGMPLEKAIVSKGGCLLHDREFAIIDEKGNFVNGKNNPLVHRLRTTFDIENKTVSFRRQDENDWNQFHLEKNNPEIQSYLSAYFGMPVLLKQDQTGRFMDVPDIAGATILSTASLQSVSGWYPGLDVNETRKRFRATLEIDGVPAFWEDRLFSKEGKGIEFMIGEVTLMGIRPCSRCVVPSRNPEMAEAIHGFQKMFVKQRATNLPGWSALNDYGHHYYLSVNCFIPATEIGKWIEVGNEVKIK